jgi:hypothetical protein
MREELYNEDGGPLYIRTCADDDCSKMHLSYFKVSVDWRCVACVIKTDNGIILGSGDIDRLKINGSNG